MDAEEKAQLESQLAQLRAIQASGVLSSSQDGQTTTFRSMAELKQAIRSLETRLGIRKRKRYSYIGMRY